jgi:hypothetical protein
VNNLRGGADGKSGFLLNPLQGFSQWRADRARATLNLHLKRSSRIAPLRARFVVMALNGTLGQSGIEPPELPFLTQLLDPGEANAQVSDAVNHCGTVVDGAANRDSACANFPNIFP